MFPFLANRNTECIYFPAVGGQRGNCSGVLTDGRYYKESRKYRPCQPKDGALEPRPSQISMTTSTEDDWVRMAVLLLFLLLLTCGRASGQTFQFLPEVDVFYKVQPDIRFNFQAKETREAGDPTQAEIGPGFDFFLKPLAPLRRITAFDLDESKSRPLQLSAGFRYVPSPDKPHTDRLIVAATPRLPLVWSILLSDRNRMDLDWSQNQFTWRYRNRLTL